MTRTDIIRANASLLEKVEQDIDSADTLNLVLNSAYEGIVVVNAEGVIQEINEAYCQIINKKREDVIGLNVVDVIENTRLDIIAKSGIEERGHIQRISGMDLVVHRIPIMKNNKPIGAIGMLIFKNISEMQDIYSRVNLNINYHKNTHKEKEDGILEQIIGSAILINEAKERARKAAACPSNVFISGSSGTGKEVFARAIHDMSSYSNGKFVCVNCSAIPENLLESELFGYEEGAFTDAQRGGKIGKFELAEGGTIFLDEIGDMPLHLQAKLLRVIQERTIEKIGSLEQKQIDVRIISATHRNLKEMIKNNLFREDLYYRINVVPVELPDLKDRSEDIPIFINKFITDFCTNFQMTPKIVSKKAMKILSDYEWPGNIRQLINVCEALVVLVSEPVIEVKHLPIDIQRAANKRALVMNNQSVTEIEKKEINSAVTNKA
jgi:transcriptional regulator with PAS, ATPase and Fis domain